MIIERGFMIEHAASKGMKQPKVLAATTTLPVVGLQEAS